VENGLWTTFVGWRVEEALRERGQDLGEVVAEPS
jgi:hypothetical protein